MITTTENPRVTRGNGGGIIAFICNKISTLLAIPFEGDLSDGGRENAPVEVDRDEQFRAYVNNRLNILLMWIQQVKPREVESAKMHLGFFLSDMEHHFVDPSVDKEIWDAYRWVKAYVRAYPARTKGARTEKAYAMISKIYESLGMAFPLKGRVRQLS